MSLARLYITDGTTYVDLLGARREPNANGISLVDWQPARPELKGGGTWQSSPLSDGRVLTDAHFENVIETFVLAAHFEHQDALIQACQDCDRLLIAARDYWLSRWADTPVYLIARSPDETNFRYAVIRNYGFGGESNPYAQPMYSRFEGASFGELTLLIERGHWQSTVPGEADCVEIESGEPYKAYFRGRKRREFVGGAYKSVCIPSTSSYNILQEDGFRILQEDGNALLQDAATLNYDQADECYIANYHVSRNLTHIFWYDASVPAWGPNLALAAPPFRFFPLPAGNGDQVYFGIDNTSMNAGPWGTLVFHLGSAWDYAAGESVLWEYWDGAAWATLYFPQDNTQGGDTPSTATKSFRVNGCVSFCFAPPSTMAATLINGVTAYWIRCTLTAVGGKTPPTQLNRYIYTPCTPFIEVGTGYGLTGLAPDVGGDIPALARLRVHCQSAYDSYIVAGSFQESFDRLIVGLRSLWRGADFSPYINLSDTYEPTGGGIAVVIDAPESKFWTTSFAPSWRGILYTQPMIAALARQFHVVIGGTKAAQYTGRYRCFLRCIPTTSTIQMRLRISSNSPDSTLGYYTETVTPAAGTILVDFGIITLPATGDGQESPATNIFISVEIGTTMADVSIRCNELILLPVDEWFADSAETINASWEVMTPSAVLRYLDIDSTSNPKQTTLSALRDFQDEQVQTNYPITTAGPAILQANKSQRFWFLMEQYLPVQSDFSPSPSIVASVKLNKVERYLSMRGAR